MRTFQDRLHRAIRHIERGETHGRELDEAFENWDGDAMVVALMQHALVDVSFAAALAKACASPLPKSWQDLYRLHGRKTPYEIQEFAAMLRASRGVYQAVDQLLLF